MKRKVSLFPTATKGNWDSEMDLRKELDLLFRGEGPESGKAHWIKLRHFDKTALSRYWKSDTGESVGGPKWEYTDSAVLSFYTLRPPLNFSTDALAHQPMLPARLDSYHLIYYFEHDITIDVDDIVFELNWEQPQKPVNLDSIASTKRFHVRYVHDFRSDDQGRIEYKGAICRIDDVSYG